jgi:hypothetical protein
MIIPEPYLPSIWILIVCGVIFFLLFLLHLCRDYGFYNQHRGLEERRQKFQKVEYNLSVCQNIVVSPISPERRDIIGDIILCPPRPQVNPIQDFVPLKAVKLLPNSHVESAKAVKFEPN